MKTPTLKNIGLIGAGAAGTVALTIGAATVVGAQDDPTLENEPTTGEVERPREVRHQALIDELIADGVITQEQVDDFNAVREAIHEHRETQRQAKLEGVADVLGMSVDELREARRSGQTLAEIAGDDLSALVEYFTAQATARINDAVADGLMTQEQADERLDGLSDRIESRLESGGGFGRRGPGHHRGHGRGFGPQGFDRGGDAVAPADVAST